MTKKSPLCVLALFVLSWSPCISQTGPGGVGNATGASSQPTNVLWLRGGSGVTQSGTVDNWADQSGNALNAAGVSSTRPTYVSSDANFNNQPVIDFSATGTNKHLTVTDNIILDNVSGVSLFVVFRTNSTATTALLSKRVDTDDNQSYMMWIASSLNSRISSNSIAGGTISTGTTYVASTVYSGASTTVTNYINGSSASTGTAPSSIPNNASDLYVGGFDVSSGETRNLDGRIAEAIIYTTALNAAQRQIVENYLSSKYGFTLTAGDVYAGDTGGNGNYDFGVVGIGRASSTSHTEANSSGFILSTYNGTLDTDGEFVMAGHTNITNAVSVSNLGTGVQQRWARAWYVDKTTAGTLDAAITFDFSEGISGQYPQDKNDYELLRYNGSTYDIVTIASGDKLISGDRITFRVASASLTDGIYTLGTTDATNSSVVGAANRTWYSYQTGNWGSYTSWTLDGGVTPLFVNPSSETPAASDNVVITSGRTITMTTNTISANNLEVNGVLTVAATSGHAFANIAGTGRIRISGASGADNFPSGTTTDFANATTGGTVEVYGTGMTLSQTRTLNDLIINLTSGITSITASTITLNGDLDVTSGTLRFNDGSAAVNSTLAVYGNVTVGSSGLITVSTSNQRHQLDMYGNLTNSGTVQFTNRTSATYTSEATNGIVDANFLSSTKNQAITCNGVTRFYRIKIDKGTDDTYSATFTASSTSNFLLFGYSNSDNSDVAQLTSSTNAFTLLRGTAEIGTNISIPVLSNTGNYNISAGATLWVNGGTVLKNNGNSLVPYGKLRVTAGTLEAKVSSGITTRDNGTILIDGSTAILNTNQIRTSILGTANVGGYIQTAGTVTVDGGFAGGTNLDYYVFSLTYSGNVFQMSGGTLTVRGARSGTGGTRGAIFINSDPANVSITGGSIVAVISNANPYVITSRAPFWNLTLQNTFDATNREVDLLGGTSGPSGGGASEITLQAQDLVVKGGLTINNYVTLDHNGNDVTIQGNLTITTNGNLLYDASKPNVTTLNGDDNALLTFNNHFTAAAGDEQQFWNFVVNKPATKTITFASAKSDLTGNNNNLLRINGEYFKLLSGIVNQGSHSIRMYCDTVLNYGTLGVFVSNATNDGTPNDRNDLIKFRDDNEATTLLTTDNSIFGAVRLNSGDEAIALVSDVYIKFLQFNYGRMNLGTHNLKLDELRVSLSTNADSLGFSTAGAFSVEDMFMTDGNSSDGGLSIYVPAATANNTKYTFPIGIGLANDVTNNANGAVYMQARVNVRSVGDDGYITINPVQHELQTTNLSGFPSILSSYWRVRHTGFSTLPIVSYEFIYDQSDVQGTETDYRPGKVLDVSPFTRSLDGNTTDVAETYNVLVFNGSSNNATFPGNGFTLESANYTAGETGRFSGTPEVYYSKRYTTDDYSIDWNSTNYWTRATTDIDGNGTVDADEVHDSRQPNASDYPKVGDIAVIGWVPWDDPSGNNGKPHGIAINNTETVAELRFTKMLNNSGNAVARNYVTNFHFRPNVVINNNGTQGQLASGAVVSGEGSFWVRSTGGNLSDPAFTGVDMGDFNAQDSAYFIYESTLSNATYVNLPSELPNVIFTTDGWGAEDKNSTISKNITVNGDLELLGDVNLIMNTGANGDITVMNDLVMYRSNANNIDSGGGGEIRFGNSGTARSITVYGDLELGNGNFAGQPGFVIRVGNADGSPITHTFNLYGNFIQNTSGSNTNVTPNGNGFKAGTSSSNDRIHFNWLGSTNSTMTSVQGDAPQLYSLTVNKGSSTSTTATVTTNMTIDGPTNAATKSLVLTAGLLHLSNSSINVTLSSGGGNFSIPSGAGLQVTTGTVNLTGSDTGLLLDGLLKVSGGTVSIDDAVGNGNNYIEYSASGSAIIEVTSGTLTVGSQIRRNLTSTAGILKYRQSGGAVVVGRRAAPTTTRGVFEVTNTNSEFTQTGGTLTLVRGINSTTVPSLLLEPATPTIFGVASNIIIGNANTPAGVNGQNVGIKANGKRLGRLTINNSSGNSPRALIYSSPLSIEGLFTIETGASFDAQGLGLVLRGDMVVNGTFTPSGNTSTFTSNGTTISLSGSGNIQFYNLTKNTTGTLNVNNNIQVTNDLRISEGTLATVANSLTLGGNAYFGTSPSTTGTHTSTGGNGIVFAGAAQQQLFALRSNGLASVGTVTINNANGVVVPDQADKFTVNTKLRLERGVLDIGGSLLSLASTAEIEEVNTFSVTNMIQTNSSFTDNGVTKNFAANRTIDFVYPIGQLLYTPVTFNFSGAGHTTGTSACSITVRPANERQPTITNDTEVSPCSSLNDFNNVLQYHWIVTAASVASSFQSEMTLKYDQTLVADDSGPFETDYIGARVLASDNTIGKFPGIVSSSLNTITFAFSGVTHAGISGEYFAGDDCAIPNNVVTYETLGTGVSGSIYNLGIYSGGPSAVPVGSVLVVEEDDVVYVDVSNVSLYKTEIYGTLVVQSGTIGNRLGTVTGTGTLRLEVNSPNVSVVMPAGFYNEFFACSGGGLELGGNTDYEVPGGITSLRRLILDGTGSRIMPNNDLLVCEDFTVTGATFNNSNNRNITIERDLIVSSGTFNSGINNFIEVERDILVNGGSFAGQTGGTKTVQGDITVSSGTFTAGSGGTLAILGDIVYSGGTFSGGSGTHLTSFEGTAGQSITGNISINRLQMSNASGLTLNGNVTVGNELLLTSGNITTGSNELLLPASAFITHPTDPTASFINGELKKVMNASTSFTFPVGKGSIWRGVTVNNPTSGGTTWEVEYFNSAPGTHTLVDNYTPSSSTIKTISQVEYWVISTGAASNTARIGLSWGSESDVSTVSTEREDMQVMVWNDGTSRWNNYGGTSFSSGHSQSRGSFVSSSTISFSEHVMTLGSSDDANPLPVELTYFKGENSNGFNYLNWRTATETENDYFEVQRSYTGEVFESIGMIEGRGTTTDATDYGFIDELPQVGVNYYRLKQVDFNGEFEYSPIIRVLNDENAPVFNISVYPNPVSSNGEITVRAFKSNDALARIVLYNQNGQPVTHVDVLAQGMQENTLGMRGLTPGVYMIEMVQGNKRVFRRVMVK